MCSTCVMEQDITQTTGGYLKSLQEAETISLDAKQVLEVWLCQQIEQERKEWKKKIQMSLKEVERERKTALDMFHHIQQLNDKLEDDIKDLLVTSDEKLYVRSNREKSGYFGSDKNAREALISKVKKNMGMLLYELEVLLTDRQRCFRYLGLYSNPETNGNNNNAVINTNQLTVLECFKKKIRLLEKKYDVTRKQLEDDDGKLKRDVTVLRETMRAYENSNQQHQQKYAKELAVILAVLSKRMEKDAGGDCCLQVACNHQISHDLYKKKPLLPRPRDTCHAAMTSSADYGSSRTDTRGHVDVGIQVSFADCSQPDHCMTSEDDSDDPTDSSLFPHPVTAVMINNRRIEGTNDSNGAMKLWVKSDENAPQKLVKPMKFTTKNQLRTRVLDNVQKSHDFMISPRATDRNIATTTGMMTSRSVDMNVCSPPITTRGTVSQPEHNPTTETIATENQQNVFPAVDKKTDSVGVNDLSSQLKHSLENFRVNSSAKCLRCHRLYKVHENNARACKFHPKSKKKMEKYDITGKLLTLSYLWECCQQGPEVHGCTSGEHV